MGLTDDGAAPTRRRGAELEAALLDAAWEQLTETGYAGFSYEAIAERAGTSKPVLYRRWPTRRELLDATLAHRGAGEPMPDVDTGNLRDDLLGLLASANARPQRFFALFSTLSGAFYESGLRPGDIREAFLSATPRRLDVIVDRAIARGEVDAAVMTERVRSVPFDLFRMQLLLTLEPLPERDLVAIVDEVFLPLVTGRR